MTVGIDSMEGLWLQVSELVTREGPSGLRIWQWLALVIGIVLAVAAGFVLSRITRGILSRIVARTAMRSDDALPEKLTGPLRVAWALGIGYLALSWIGLPKPAWAFVATVISSGLFFVFFWSLARIVDIAGQGVVASAWAAEHSAFRALVPLATRIARIGIWAIAVVAMLSALGYPVASLVAGLGIGGLALALGAQKTLENLFGAFSIGGDQPFREGDFVRIEDFVGTVETIGLRSTRIRTLDRTLISIPNGKLADMRLESFTARDRIRLACTIGLVYETTAAQMRNVLTGLEAVLRDHPKIWPDAVVVRFKELADFSLNIEVMAWFLTADWGEFQLIRQEILLRFMEVVEQAGTSFAFPTTTVHLASGRPQ